MAQERLTGRVNGALAGGAAGNPGTVQEARRAVEQSRERIAATLDQLEGRIVETKASIQRKADIVRPAREAIRTRPLIALGVAVAVGIFLGTRGGSHLPEKAGDVTRF